MVLCVHCKLDLPREAFGKRKDKKNGLTSWCRDCNQKRGKRNRAKFKKKIQEYHKQKNQDIMYKAHRRKYCRERSRKLKPTEEQRSKRRTYQKEHYHKKKQEIRNQIKAQAAVKRALANGSLGKLKCEYPNCKYPMLKVNAHHKDYTKPLEVVWLCTQHHGLADRIRRLYY